MKIEKWLNIFVGILVLIGSSVVNSQTRAGVLSPDQIRSQAGLIRQYKELLASPDASIRYAAVSEMLNSKDNALRVLAFDMAFQSADSSIRALALKERIMSMTSLVVEPANESVANQLADKRLSRIVIPLSNRKPVDGVVDVAGASGMLASYVSGSLSIAGEDVVINMDGSNYGTYVIGRFRLSDGGKLVGGLQWTLQIEKARSTGTFPAIISLN